MAHPTIPLAIKYMRVAFRILGVIAPPVAVAWAYRLWFRSPRYKSPRREHKWRKQARAVRIASPYGRIMTYHWGEADRPRVFLIHGWSGRGVQLGAFVEPLVRAGYSVTSFDAPGHGESDGDATSLFQVAEVLRQIVLEASQPCALIAHSFGCMVSAYALRDYQLPVKKFIAISSPTSLKYLFEGFFGLFQLNSRVIDGFLARIKHDFGEDLMERTSADNNLRGWSGRLLVIHDKDDEIVHWQYGERLASARPDSEVLYTYTLGHRRILGDQRVIETAVKFIQGPD